MSATKTSRRKTYRINPAGLMDRTDSRVLRCTGQEVHVIQPAGCPNPSRMGMAYVQNAVTGDFIGLVSKSSLTATGTTKPLRDLAAEARDARSERLRKPSPFQVV
jgi:hypothetical protein